LAIEYCYKYKEEHAEALVLWVSAASSARIEQGFRDIARTLSLPTQSHSAVQVVVQWLRERQSAAWILVLDDFQVGMAKSSLKSLPSGIAAATQSSTFISQNADMLDLGNVDCHSLIPKETRLLVTTPDSHDSVAILRKKIPPNSYDEHEFQDLVQALEYSPLAITLAGSYIGENAISPRRYLAEFKALQRELKAPFFERLELSQEQREIPKSIVKAFLLAVKQVRIENPIAIEILSLATVLDRQILPMALLFRGDHNVRPFYIVMRKLQAFSLIKKRRFGANYSMNRYVQLLCEVCLRSQGKFGSWTEKALVILAMRCGHGDQSFWRIYEMINPHAHKILDSRFIGRSFLPRGVLLKGMGSYEQRQGNYSGAYETYLKAHKVYLENSEYGRKHRETFKITQRAIEVLTSLDRDKEAEEKIKEVRAEMEETLGAEDHQYLASGNMLAKIYHGQGRYGDAELLYRGALKANIEAHHENHVDSLTIKNDLAILLIDQGKYDQAEKHFRETLEGRKLERDKDHPDTLQSMTGLATVLARQGKYVDAEKLNREALTISERVQGPKHPDTLKLLNNLAINLADLGRYSDAEKMHRRHVAVTTQTLGMSNSRTILAKMNLAALLNKMGNVKASEQEYEEALRANLKLFGEDNLVTVHLWSSLGVVYLKQKEYVKAEDMIKKSVEQREKLLGLEHPETLISRNNLAGVMQRLRKYKDAEKGFSDVLTASTKMGHDHPLVLRVRNNLGELLRESNMKLDKAEELLRSALAGRQKKLGIDHPDTLITMYNLAHLLHDKGRFEDAEPLYKEALEGMRKRLGVGHPSTMDCAENFKLMIAEKR
jgi:tetratricopeptide (TPR) repeat protein